MLIIGKNMINDEKFHLCIIKTTSSNNKAKPRQPGESHEEFMKRTKNEFFVDGIRDSKPSVRKGYCWW